MSQDNKYQVIADKDLFIVNADEYGVNPPGANGVLEFMAMGLDPASPGQLTLICSFSSWSTVEMLEFDGVAPAKAPADHVLLPIEPVSTLDVDPV